MKNSPLLNTLFIVLCGGLLALTMPVSAAEPELTYRFDSENAHDAPNGSKLIVASDHASGVSLVRAVFKTHHIRAVSRRDQGDGKFVPVETMPSTPGGQGEVMVSPGTYVVRVGCSGGLGVLLLDLVPQDFDSPPVKVEAGYDYTFTCTGRSRARLHVEAKAILRDAALVIANAASATRSTSKETSSEPRTTDKPWSAPSTRPQVPIPDRTLSLDQPIDDRAAMTLVRDAFGKRQWVLTEEHTSWVRATQNTSDYSITVDIVHDGPQLRVVYLDSTNLGYAVRKGKASISDDYDVFVDRSLKDIETVLAIPVTPGVGRHFDIDAPWAPQPTKPYEELSAILLTLPGELPQDRVMLAIQDALRNRRWEATEIHRDWIRATLRLRAHLLVVDIVPSPGTVKVFYVASHDLDYGVKKGKAQIHDAYYGWTHYLLNDTAVALGLPPPFK